MFTIKLAYHVQNGDSQINRAHTASTSFRISDSKWKKLWSIPLKPKVRNFLWRALHKNLAVGENLVKKGYVVRIFVVCVEIVMNPLSIFSLTVLLLEQLGVAHLYHLLSKLYRMTQIFRNQNPHCEELIQRMHQENTEWINSVEENDGDCIQRRGLEEENSDDLENDGNIRFCCDVVME